MNPPLLLSGAATPILDIDSTFFIYVGVFGALFLLLRQFVFGPMMALFDAREAAIEGAQQGARDLEKEAEAKLSEFEKEMTKVRAEASLKREELKSEGRRLEQSLTEKVRTETETMVRDAEEKMAGEAKKIRQDIETNTPALANEIATKLLGREIKA